MGSRIYNAYSAAHRCDPDPSRSTSRRHGHIGLNSNITPHGPHTRGRDDAAIRCRSRVKVRNAGNTALRERSVSGCIPNYCTPRVYTFSMSQPFSANMCGCRQVPKGHLQSARTGARSSGILLFQPPPAGGSASCEPYTANLTIYARASIIIIIANACRR